jgi:hypothetical protein
MELYRYEESAFTEEENLFEMEDQISTQLIASVMRQDKGFQNYLI